MPTNALGREIPDAVAGRPLRPYPGAFATVPTGRRAGGPLKTIRPGANKVAPSLDEAIRRSGLRDGMTISFHHCFRDGDRLVLQVVEACARLGIGDLRLFPTALFPCHEPLVRHIGDGVVTRIEGSLNGPIGAFISRGGKLREPPILRSHGGRWRAVACGEVEIDVAFIAASEADPYGNANGIHGPHACGPISFSVVDSWCADHVVVVTDNLAPYPAVPPTIEQGYVDQVAVVDQVGDPAGIVTGTLRVTRSPTALRIAKLAVDAVAAAGLIREGMSFQAGAGGTSLAAQEILARKMARAGVHAAFAIGGTTKYLVAMLKEGLVRTILDGQAFDGEAVQSLRTNPRHQRITPGFYADYNSLGCATYMLDFAFLGGTEVDLDFNVNVNTHSDGQLLHGIGGHQDVAAGARVTVITMPTLRGRVPVIRDQVTTVTTPGEVIDLVVTERGIAVNPRRPDLAEDLRRAGLPVRTLEEMKAAAERLVGKGKSPIWGDEIVGVIQWRDGTVIDVVRKVEGWA
ncbi:MAG TPA: citrate lyase subunit alpha [Candidatus Acetothermia bacterium]|nr:citrate lyase subunit alpha [Candidatus Acetothermia bacterium]